MLAAWCRLHPTLTARPRLQLVRAASLCELRAAGGSLYWRLVEAVASESCLLQAAACTRSLALVAAYVSCLSWAAAQPRRRRASLVTSPAPRDKQQQHAGAGPRGPSHTLLGLRQRAGTADHTALGFQAAPVAKTCTGRVRYGGTSACGCAQHVVQDVVRTACGAHSMWCKMWCAQHVVRTACGAHSMWCKMWCAQHVVRTACGARCGAHSMWCTQHVVQDVVRTACGAHSMWCAQHVVQDAPKLGVLAYVCDHVCDHVCVCALHLG